MLIDLGLMKGIRVDPEARTVRAQAGVLLGELDRETQAFGLAVPAGIVTHTGVAGLTLGGGIGWIMRKYGLTIDNLAVGRHRHRRAASSSRPARRENADLFWGVRGGGGNFGIVTEFEFRLNPLGPQVMAGPVFWPMEECPTVLRFYRDWIAGCPDELMTIVVQRKAPALPFVPPELVGKHVIGVVACYAGPVEDGERVMRPLKSFGSPVLDLCVPKPFLVHQATFDPSFQHGWWYYVRSCDVAELNDDVIDIVGRIRPADRVADHERGPLADGWGGRPRRRGRDRLQRTAGRFHLQHQRQQRDGRRLRGGARSGRAATGPRSRLTTPAST